MRQLVLDTCLPFLVDVYSREGQTTPSRSGFYWVGKQEGLRGFFFFIFVLEINTTASATRVLLTTNPLPLLCLTSEMQAYWLGVQIYPAIFPLKQLQWGYPDAHAKPGTPSNALISTPDHAPTNPRTQPETQKETHLTQ
ncbi:hypothetical protein VTJ04DRAFT_2949 [Mycothermus thermophilus]|uniref:uncharacterized protein n=1 Tax=Humicola insolens TaxID=85995 RepID=UPI003741F6F9